MGDPLSTLQQVLGEGPLPHLFVFDLDYTLWPCYVDCLAGPPFRVDKNGIIDRRNWEVQLYDDVKPIFTALVNHDCKIALASRTEEPSWAEEIIRLMKIVKERTIHDIVHAKEIYPGSKERHFAKFKKATSIPFENMLFFDDESRNIHEVSRLGVTSILCERGLDIHTFVRGVREFRSRRCQDTP